MSGGPCPRCAPRSESRADSAPASYDPRGLGKVNDSSYLSPISFALVWLHLVVERHRTAQGGIHHPAVSPPPSNDCGHMPDRRRSRPTRLGGVVVHTSEHPHPAVSRCCACRQTASLNRARSVSRHPQRCPATSMSPATQVMRGSSSGRDGDPSSHRSYAMSAYRRLARTGEPARAGPA